VDEVDGAEEAKADAVAASAVDVAVRDAVLEDAEAFCSSMAVAFTQPFALALNTHNTSSVCRQ